MMKEPLTVWYREPIAWLVMGLPATAVVVGLYTYWLAATTSDGLVVDDYYKEGLAINRDLARDDRAQALGLTAQIALTADSVTIVLTARNAANLPDALQVSLVHATRPGLDRRLLVQAAEPGHYRAALAGLPPGHWHVHLEAGDWRIVSEQHLH